MPVFQLGEKLDRRVFDDQRNRADAGYVFQFSYASIWARMFSGFKTSFSLASKTGATVSSVSSGVSVWSMQTELKKLRAVSLG